MGCHFLLRGIFLEGRLKLASSALAAGFCITESPEIIVPYNLVAPGQVCPGAAATLQPRAPGAILS